MAKAYGDEHLATMEAPAPPPVPTTSIFTDKTIWLNLLGPVFVWLATKGVNVTPDIQVLIVGGVMALANWVARYFTDHGVHVLPPASGGPEVTAKDFELMVEAMKALQEQMRDLQKSRPPAG